ncbi:MAG: SRPBCC domain-containing protein [Candidatus Kapaibacterium sp.]
MKKIQYTIQISAPASNVYDVMLGITSKSTYKRWTAAFNPTSTYEGSWDKGSKMLFVGTDEKGEKGGMVSEIAENIPNRFISIRHYGMVQGNEEITEGPAVEKWANGFENYTFEEHDGSTLVTVDLDTTDDFVDFMNETYPKALDTLKEICED